MIALFLFLGMWDYVIIKNIIPRHMYRQCGFQASMCLIVITLLLESLAIASLLSYAMSYPLDCNDGLDVSTNSSGNNTGVGNFTGNWTGNLSNATDGNASAVASTDMNIADSDGTSVDNADVHNSTGNWTDDLLNSSQGGDSGDSSFSTDDQTPDAEGYCFQTPECVDANCTALISSRPLSALYALLAMAAVSLIPRVMAASKSMDRELEEGVVVVCYESIFAVLVWDRQFCRFGWILLSLPLLMLGAVWLTWNSVTWNESHAGEYFIALAFLLIALILLCGALSSLLHLLSAIVCCCNDAGGGYMCPFYLVTFGALSVDILLAIRYYSGGFTIGGVFLSADSLRLFWTICVLGMRDR